VRNFLLFIDTEGSGLPKDWSLPYSAKDNWPFSVQVSWVIYDKNGGEVKEENYFIRNSDFEITLSALKIHRITPEFLQANGKSREEVLRNLSNDLEKYQPLVVGHFLELDSHMVGADFYRLGQKSLMVDLPGFCTMLATTHLVRNPSIKYMRLDELYTILFNKHLDNQHDALVDARATAECFFELLKRGDIDEEKIESQSNQTKTKALQTKEGCSLVVLIIVLSIISIAFSV
jgi:DNA polymerase III subunit epsilon